MTSGELHRRRGYDLFQRGFLDWARAELDQAIALEPDLAEAWSNRGDVKWALGRLGDALADHDQAIALAPERGEYYHHRGVVYEDLGPEAWPRALADCTRAVELPNPRRAAALNSRAAIHRLRGEVDEAVADWRRAIAADPALYKPYVNLAMIHRERGELEACAPLLDEAARCKACADVLAERAMLALALCDRERARADFERALELDPRHVQARNDYAVFLHDEGAHREALAHLDVLVAVGNDDPDVSQNRAVVLLALGRPDDALATCRRALAATPTSPDLHGLLAALLAERGDPQAARAALLEGLLRAPRDPDLLENLGILERAARAEREAD